MIPRHASAPVDELRIPDNHEGCSCEMCQRITRALERGRRFASQVLKASRGIAPTAEELRLVIR